MYDNNQNIQGKTDTKGVWQLKSFRSRSIMFLMVSKMSNLMLFRSARRLSKLLQMCLPELAWFWPLPELAWFWPHHLGFSRTLPLSDEVCGVGEGAQHTEPPGGVRVTQHLTQQRLRRLDLAPNLNHKWNMQFIEML